MMRLAAAKHELTEILVVGEEYPFLIRRSSEDAGVIGLGHDLGHSQHVMTSHAQVFDSGGASGLVYKETHEDRNLCRSDKREHILVG